jgi:hypothetical protein
MTVKTTKITVDATADLLGVGVGGKGSSLAINPAADIYVGGSDVTSATGYLVSAGVNFIVDLEQGEELYGITASGSSVVSVFTQGA